jgi:hypothetical protein
MNYERVIAYVAVAVEMHNTGDSNLKADVVASIEHALANKSGAGEF